jgi:uncharacterized protein YceH (UPF0502 family)
MAVLAVSSVAALSQWLLPLVLVSWMTVQAAFQYMINGRVLARISALEQQVADLRDQLDQLSGLSDR